MPRLIIFVSFILITSLVFVLKSYRSVEVDNQPFDKKKAVEAYQKRQEEIQLALNPPKVEEVEEVQEEKKPILVLETEAQKLGYEVYMKKGQCLTCHGKHGEGKKSQLAPKVAGQFSWYLEEQLNLMKSEKRYNAKMNPYLKKLDENDFRALAAFLSSIQEP